MIVGADGRNPPDLFTVRIAGVSEAHRAACAGNALTSSIEQTQCIRVITDHDGHGVVIEHLSAKRWFGWADNATGAPCTHSRDILARELVRCVRYEETRLAGGQRGRPLDRNVRTHLADSTISNDHTLDCLHRAAGGLTSRVRRAGEDGEQLEHGQHARTSRRSCGRGMIPPRSVLACTALHGAHE